METSEEANQTRISEEICANGDIVLVVGPQSVRMRVHSQCLRCASKVFTAMFGPHWSEGQDLSEDSPKEVTFEEDNAEALYAACCVIHHRNDLLPHALSPQEVLEIAITADKYDLGIALKHARTLWLQPTNRIDLEGTAYLMAAALLFDDPRSFRETSKALIFQHKGTYRSLLTKLAIYGTLPDPDRIACKWIP